MFKKLFELLVFCVFPPFCCSCQKLGSYLCRNCFELCVFNPFPVKLKLEPLYLDSISAPLELSGPISPLIHTFKYKSVKPIGATLAKLLFLTATIPRVDMVTAVPLHHHRQRERGFNQAEEIAIHLAKLLNAPYRPLLVRSKPTSAQAKLKRQDRLEHLANCFKPSPGVLNIPQKVLLIDDVTTTGTTLNECAKILKNMGVKAVHSLVVAHGGS